MSWGNFNHHSSAIDKHRLPCCSVIIITITIIIIIVVVGVVKQCEQVTLVVSCPLVSHSKCLWLWIVTQGHLNTLVNERHRVYDYDSRATCQVIVLMCFLPLCFAFHFHLSCSPGMQVSVKRQNTLRRKNDDDGIITHGKLSCLAGCRPAYAFDDTNNTNVSRTHSWLRLWHCYFHLLRRSRKKKEKKDSH